MPRPEEMGKEAWDKLTATVSDDQLEWIERFARYDQAEFIPSYATLGLIARLRAAEVDAGRYRFIRERACGNQQSFQVVVDAAFSAEYGLDFNFDMNIDEAMKGKVR